MKYGLAEESIQKIRSVFAGFPGIDKAVLYGSRAKGNYKPGSDIDLTLYGASLTASLHAKIAEALDDLLLPYTIDLSLFDELDNAKLREHIERVGVTFYERMVKGVAATKGWEVKKLGDILQKTETIDPTKNPDKEFIYIDVSSVNNETFSIEATTILKGKDAPSRARKLVKKNDIIFATVRPTLRRICLITEEYNNQVCSTGYFVLRAKENISHALIFYYLQTEAFNKKMEELQKGASYPAVTDGDVRDQLISYPKSLSEQHRIVAILDEVFAAITKAKDNAEKNLQNARDIFNSNLQSIFTKRGAGWKEKTLEEIATTFGRGKSKHRPRNAPKLYGGKYPFIQTGDIRNADHFITGYSQTYSEAGLAQSKLWPKGTICITIAANIAETGILGFDACFPDSVIGVVTNPKEAEVDFVEYLLQSFKVRLQAKGKGSAQANINMGTFEEERFPFPPVAEQKIIVAKLNALREETLRLESLYQQKLTNLEDLKKSILQKAFAGELSEVSAATTKRARA
jgi:type I restriction enzyme S subunit